MLLKRGGGNECSYSVIGNREETLDVLTVFIDYRLAEVEDAHLNKTSLPEGHMIY